MDPPTLTDQILLSTFKEPTVELSSCPCLLVFSANKPAIHPFIFVDSVVVVVVVLIYLFCFLRFHCQVLPYFSGN